MSIQEDGCYKEALVSFQIGFNDSSAFPTQDLPRPSLQPFVSFMALWSELWGFYIVLKYALT